MKLDLNTLRRLNEHYGAAGEIAPYGVQALVDRIGAQLGGVDEVINIGDKYQGIVIAKIVKADKHPDADKLSLVDVTTGASETRVVCGAPNVVAGMTVPYAPAGATLPGGFTLERRKIRGQVSDGMLCSARELGLGDDHAGIVILPAESPLAIYSGIWHSERH